MTSDRPDHDPTPLGSRGAADAAAEVTLDADLATRLAEMEPPDPQRRERAITAALHEYDTAPWRTPVSGRPRWQLASIAAAALLIVGGGIAALGLRSGPSDDLASNAATETEISAMAGVDSDEPAPMVAAPPDPSVEMEQDVGSSATSEPLLGALPPIEDPAADTTSPPISDGPTAPAAIDTPEGLAEFAANSRSRAANLPGCAPTEARGLGAITYRGIPAVAIAVGDEGMIHAMAADDCRILATVTVAARPSNQ